MKIRTGFVSNSSSSSYVCNICGGAEIVYDGCLDDVDMSCCWKGHEFCNSHNPEYTLADMKRILLADEEYLRDLSEEKVSFIKSESKELIKDIFGDYKSNTSSDEMPPSMCPVCQLKSISDGMILSYLLKECGKTKNEIEADIRNKFDTLEQLQEKLK